MTNPERALQIVTFNVPGRIRGKGRPRATVKSGFARLYTDAKTRSDEALVKHFAALAMGSRKPFEGPLALDVTLILNTPPSWSKKRRAKAVHVTGKPDLDNVLKLIGDACNGVLWSDDSQICEVYFRRRYDDTRGESVLITVSDPSQSVAEHVARAA